MAKILKFQSLSIRWDGLQASLDLFLSVLYLIFLLFCYVGLGEEFLHGIICTFQPNFIIPLLDMTASDQPERGPIESCPEVILARQHLEEIIYKKRGQISPYYRPLLIERYRPLILPLASKRSFTDGRSSKYHNKDLRYLCSSVYFTKPVDGLKGFDFVPMKFTKNFVSLPISSITTLYDVKLPPTHTNIYQKLSTFQYCVVGLYDKALLLGLGYIQSINYSSKMIQLLTPIASSFLLGRVNALKPTKLNMITSRELSDSFISTIPSSSKGTSTPVGNSAARPRYDLPRKRPTD